MRWLEEAEEMVSKRARSCTIALAKIRKEEMMNTGQEEWRSDRKSEAPAHTARIKLGLSLCGCNYFIF